MKSKDFHKLNEISLDPWAALGNYAVKKLGGANPAGSNSQQQKNFVNMFSQQFNREHQIHPNMNVDDFLEMYWRKNNWDASNLPPAYQQSLDSAKQAAATNASPQAVQQLANVVYSIALMMPSSGATAARNAQQTRQNVQQPQQPQQQNTNPAAGDGQLDPNTNQIISKIRSIKNTPEEIDDLVDIIAISLFKLYKIAPKNYKRIIMSLFNNGGKPSMPASNNMAPQTKTPQVQQTTAATPPTQAATNYSGGQQQSPTPSSISYTNNVKATPNNATAPNNAQNSSVGGTAAPTGGRNAEFTGQGLGRIEPVNTTAADKISQNALDKRINARGNVQSAMTTRAGLPK